MASSDTPPAWRPVTSAPALDPVTASGEKPASVSAVSAPAWT